MNPYNTKFPRTKTELIFNPTAFADDDGTYKCRANFDGLTGDLESSAMALFVIGKLLCILEIFCAISVIPYSPTEVL